MAEPDTDQIAELRQQVETLQDEVTELRQRTPDWSVSGLMDLGLTRRQAAKAVALVAAGYTLPTAIINVLTDPASADAVGSEGTQADPLSKLWTHEIESGDGASNVTVPDTFSMGALSQNSINQLLRAVLNSNDLVSIDAQYTQDVSTTGKTIFNRNSDNPLGYFIAVMGEADSDNDRFLDIVQAVGGAVNVTSHDDASADGRTYSMTSTEIDLQMGSGTYQVAAIGFTLRAA